MGNLLVVGYTVFNPGTLSFSDNYGNTWHQVPTTPTQDGGSNYTILYYTVITSTGSGFAISFNATNGPTLVVAEYNPGAGATISLEQSNYTTGQSTQPTLSMSSVTAGDLDICVMRSENGGTITLSSGWTIEQQQTDDGTHERQVFADNLSSASGTITCTATAGYTGAWGMALGAFKATGGGGTPNPGQFFAVL